MAAEVVRHGSVDALGISWAVVLVELILCWGFGALGFLRSSLQASFGPYLALFFCLLTFATFLRCLSRGDGRLLADVMKGAAAGYASSALAIAASAFLVADGPERVEASVRLVGSVRFVAIQLGLAFFVGGWMAGALSFCIAPRVLARHARRGR